METDRAIGLFREFRHSVISQAADHGYRRYVDDAFDESIREMLDLFLTDAPYDGDGAEFVKTVANRIRAKHKIGFFGSWVLWFQIGRIVWFVVSLILQSLKEPNKKMAVRCGYVRQ